MTTRIALEEMRFFAYHGCFPEEKKTGNWFVVDVEITVPFVPVHLSDQLEGTSDYSRIFRITESEMSVSRNLLETLAVRICWRLLDEMSEVLEVETVVRKLNPPLPGEIKYTCVKQRMSRAEKEKLQI